MSQHDFLLENQSAIGLRQDMSNAVLALASQNSGASEPSVTFPFMPWADSGNDIYKLRNAANTDWIHLFKMSTGEPLQVNVTGAVKYKGSLDASLGQYPSDPEHGDVYRISVAGSFPVIGDVSVSDSIIYNGASWDHWDHTDQVTSVAGLMGAISDTLLLDALLAGTGAAEKIRVSLQTVISNLTGVNAAKLEGNTYADIQSWVNSEIGDQVSAAIAGIDTTLTNNEVTAAYASTSVEEIGSYCLAFWTGSGSKLPGDVVPGSQLDWSSAGASRYSGNAHSGSWRCMGYVNIGFEESEDRAITLWLRIA